jgi:class 3 adenylate cyclase
MQGCPKFTVLTTVGSRSAPASDYVAATIRQFKGFIVRYVSDGILINFGWPEAYDSAAARAIRAGLAGAPVS